MKAESQLLDNRCADMKMNVLWIIENLISIIVNRTWKQHLFYAEIGKRSAHCHHSLKAHNTE